MSEEFDETMSYHSVFETLILPKDQPESLSETLYPDELYSGGVTTVSDLPRIDISTTKNPQAEFRIVDELGRGGMGVVNLAEQRALSREVAIKSIVQNHPEARDALLLEGRIMGMVEHPNVVPVHALGEDEDGSPIIVMKRIAGNAWNEVMGFEHDDPLGRDLGILLKICQALGFAHQLGIIHRDIKPANVMVGEFGEVYLVDWGLAVAVDDRFPNIPTIETANDIVGTPAYIAPEMTVGEGPKLGIHTDIYLVGAVLFHVIAGHPPHVGKNLFETLRSAYEGRARTYPDHAPDELERICERALAHAPADRYGDIRELQNAIEHFLQHRASLELTQRAIESIPELAQLTTTDADEELVYTAFNKLRYTFQNAIEVWTENQNAIEALDRVIRILVDYELRQDDPIAAKKLLKQLQVDDQALRERIEDALRDQEAKEERFVELKRLERDIDANVGSRSRAFPILTMGIGFLSILFFPQIKSMLGVSDQAVYVGSMFFFSIPLAIFTYTFRSTFFANFANRCLLKGFWFLWFLACILRVVVAYTETDFRAGLALELLMYAGGSAQMMLSLDRRIFIPTVAFVIGAIVTAALPETPWVWYGITGAVGSVGLAIAFYRVPTEKMTRVSFFEWIGLFNYDDDDGDDETSS